MTDEFYSECCRATTVDVRQQLFSNIHSFTTLTPASLCLATVAPACSEAGACEIYIYKTTFKVCCIQHLCHPHPSRCDAMMTGLHRANGCKRHDDDSEVPLAAHHVIIIVIISDIIIIMSDSLTTIPLPLIRQAASPCPSHLLRPLPAASQTHIPNSPPLHGSGDATVPPGDPHEYPPGDAAVNPPHPPIGACHGEPVEPDPHICCPSEPFARGGCQAWEPPGSLRFPGVGEPVRGHVEGSEPPPLLDTSCSTVPARETGGGVAAGGVCAPLRSASHTAGSTSVRPHTSWGDLACAACLL